MQNYELTLKAPVSTSFHAQKARGSVDLSDETKTWHKLKINNCDFDTPWNIGVIVGASGSGKTTLARHIYGDFDLYAPDATKAVIDQFPDAWDYDKRSSQLNAIGLSQVPCWIKPVGMLSNGQQERAKVALALANEKAHVFDEWTSVVDRNVAAAMSHTVQKFARRNNKQIILITCHYDVLDWLDPDWVIDCNEQKYTNRRELVGTERKKKMCFTIKPVAANTWHRFSKYHYLSDNLPGGLIYTFGIFLDDQQIGFQCFAEYVPWGDKKKRRVLHFNRTVIHPDYVGFGLGMQLIDLTSEMMAKKNYKIMGKFSSIPVFKAMSKNPKWKLVASDYQTPTFSSKAIGSLSKSFADTKRNAVKWWSFEFCPERNVQCPPQ